MAEPIELIEHNFKLWLHERDIIPGGVYVLESMDFSRNFYFLKTIIMLMNNGIFLF